MDGHKLDEEIVKWAPHHAHRHPEDADTRTHNHTSHALRCRAMCYAIGSCTGKAHRFV